MYTEAPKTHIYQYEVTFFLIFFFCELLEWAIQQLHLFGYDWSCILNWKGKGTMGERSLFTMGAESLGEFDKNAENAWSDGLKYYKWLHKKSGTYNTSGFVDQK